MLHRDVMVMAARALTESIWLPTSVMWLLGAPGTLILAWLLLSAARW